MAVNAAIEMLIARADDDGDAARVVIEYGSKLSGSGKFQIEVTSHTKSSGNKVTGVTPGQGNVTIENKEREKHTEWAHGVHKDRIGKFRLWKEVDGVLKFHHFWKSSITTASSTTEQPDEYSLGYDPTTLEPRYLGVMRRRLLSTFWFIFRIRVIELYLEPIYGEVPPRTSKGIILS